MSRRRTNGDETWIRLQQWLKGQKPAERMTAFILDAEGYKSIDPSHPLGGRDGLKDLVCEKDGIYWIAACYFPRSEKQFNEIKRKYQSDLEGVKVNDADGFIFVTNQELTLGQRKKLKDIDESMEVEIYHLDRIAYLLDKPQNYGLRLDFLDIEMTKEEQLSLIASRDQKLHNLTDMVERLVKDYSSFKHRNESLEDVRNQDEVSEAMEELFDKIWYDRHQILKYRVLNEEEEIDPDIWKGALDSARKVEEKYGRENLGPWSDFEWGMINGKLSALRWFFGDEWDMLDT